MVEKHEYFKLGVYSTSIFILYLLYFLTFIGISYVDKRKIHLFSVIIQTVVCFILIVRFHPFTQHEITRFDKTLIFSTASFLFINIFFTEFYAIYIHDSKIFMNLGRI